MENIWTFDYTTGIHSYVFVDGFIEFDKGFWNNQPLKSDNSECPSHPIIKNLKKGFSCLF